MRTFCYNYFKRSQELQSRLAQSRLVKKLLQSSLLSPVAMSHTTNNDEETPYFWEKVSDFYLNNGLKFDNVGFALFFSVQL